MDHFQHSKIQKHEAKHKKRLTENQVMQLESNFNHNNRLEPDRKTQLALDLGVPPRQVAVWYQNKRARDKIQGLELDYKTLQLELDSVLADNARLKAEIQGLRLELNKTRQGSTFNSLNSTSSGDEVGSSNLERELYASLVGHGGPFVAPDGYDFFG